MKKIILTIITCLTTVSLPAIQIIHSSSPYRSSEETHRLNQQEEQMQIMRENLQVQKQMLQEQQRLNRGW